ncbi:MAG: hypothetical protein WCS12_00180 [Acholeplasmataceae bacterium]|nr:hypothetical protein [Acholeplasmataceae bacterium]MCK9233566.1 hypothetical protein [Acholeplasmataceae bacterium]MCK9288790.1 hypothetical protein [Acholeplasmataceae bacterium]MCK9427304.1 hypothetical protein [Acholeplasmataceae bacterium]
MSKIKILKRSLALVLIVVVTIGLASCKKESDKIPFGNLSDQVYAEGNNFKITEKELYEEMRISGLDILNKEIEKIVFKTEIDNIKNATGQEKESYHDELVKLANKGVFGTDDLEDLKELKEKDLKQILKTYRDATFLKGVDVYEANFDIVNFKEHDEIILEQFVVSLAKKHYAEEKLLEEVDDEDSSAYIDKDEDISNYFKNNVQKRYPLSFVSIRFQNKYEADQTLRHFNIKTYRTGWFIIPNPRVEVIEEEEEKHAEAYRVLDKLNLLDDNGNLSELDHQKYFNEYSIDENIDKRLDKSEALYLFLEIYNYIYPYREINLEDLENVDLEDFVENEEYVYLNPDEDEENGLFTMRYDDFPINSQSESTLTAMRNYLYNTLSTKKEETSFTTAARSFGKYYYLLYKLKDHNDDLLEQVKDDKYQVWEDEDETILTAHAEEYYQKIVDDKLTSSYISSKASEKIKDAKVTIYDGDVHLFLGNDNYKLAKKFNNNLIAKVDDTEITVDDFYILLENQFGPSISMDLAVKKALLSSKYIDEITAEQRKEFKENIENMITQFSNNALAQSGFPASIGRKKFLKLAFKADSIEDAVEKVYIASEIEKLYLEDYLAHYEDFYENILFYSNELLEDFFSLTTGHLIIKVDMDEDENPDDPKDFFATLADSESTKYTEEKYQEAITELLQLIHKKASKYQNFEEGLKDIVKLYNDSARFECEDVYVDPDDEDAKNKLCGPEKDWAKFKNLGLQIEYQSLGEQTNKTNWPGEQNFDELFYNRIVDFYQEVKEEYYDVDKAFPKQLLDYSPTKYDGVEKPVLETSFGWHLIVALGGKVGESAKYTSENDKDGDYLNIELKDEDDKVIETIDDAYSEDETISLNQLKIYLHQKDTDYGVQDLPSSVKKALTSYVDPVMTKYESKEMRLHLLYNLIKEENFKYSSSTNTEKLAKILKINQDQFLSYADEDNYPDYYRIFGDWFTKFN